MTIDQLTAAGQLLYGDQWQANLARSLDVDVRRIRHWTAGTRPISDFVDKEVKQLLADRVKMIDDFLKNI